VEEIDENHLENGKKCRNVEGKDVRACNQTELWWSEDLAKHELMVEYGSRVWVATPGLN
jgi:hypothetical protein